MQGICEDLQMKFVRSFSADMQDLMIEQERENLKAFLQQVIDAYQTKALTPRVFPELQQPKLAYLPADRANAESLVDTCGQKIVVVSDSGSSSENMRNMQARFVSSFSAPVEVVDLTEIKIAGGCLGCVKCGMDNVCTYDGKDDVRSTYEEKMKQADIVVFALTMKDRYFSARWKNFLDRRFYQTHQPGLPGKQIGYLISGALSYEQNLRQILQASAQIDQANLVDIVTDEHETSAELDGMIAQFAQELITSAQQHVKQPKTFLGVGAAKIFRDEMWGNLRFIFQADYRYYKKHGMMNFPQSNLNNRLVNMMIPLIRIPPVKKMVQAKTKDMMHNPHDRVIQKEKEKRGQQVI